MTTPRIDTSEVVISRGGTMFAGPDAVSLFRAITLRAALRLYARTGIKTTRGAGPKVMLTIAKEYTGKTYKGTAKFDDAIADLDTWIATMKAAMPVTDTREQA